MKDSRATKPSCKATKRENIMGTAISSMLLLIPIETTGLSGTWELVTTKSVINYAGFQGNKVKSFIRKERENELKIQYKPGQNLRGLDSEPKIF